MDLSVISCLILSTLMASVCSQNPRINSGGHNDGDDLVLGTIVRDVMGEPDIPEMLEELGLTTFIDYLNTAAEIDTGVQDVLLADEPLTVFGPTNQAFDKLMSWIRRRLRNTTVLSRTLLHHMVDGLIFPEDLSNEMFLTTKLGIPLRINVFPKPGAPTVYTAQCSPILSTRSTQNAVVHKMGNVLKPPYGDMLTSLTACPVFKNLTWAMRTANVRLDDINSGPYTLFAPTDFVFRRIYPQGIDVMFRNNTRALREMVLSHVIPGTQCSAGFDRTSFRTLSGRILTPSVTQTGTTMNGVRLNCKDAAVTNGVIHCVESLLWP